MGVRSVMPMRLAKGGYIGISIVLCIAGIIMMALPNISVNVIGSFFGIVLMVFGAIKLLGYFSKDLFRLAFQYDLQFGILMLLLGLVTLFKTENVMSFITVALGICITADCLFKLTTAIDAKKFGISNWWMTFVMALINGLLGMAIMFWPQNAVAALTVILGALLLADGILNLVVAVSMVKIVKHQKPEFIDAVYREADM